MAKTYYVQYWELDRAENVQEDAFSSFNEAQNFYNEIMDNPKWDACILSAEDKAALSTR